MSYNVEIDVAEWNRLRSTLEEKFGSTGEVLAQFAEDRLVPQLEAEAGSQRNVVTGTYSGTWEASAEGDSTAVVTTGAPYWKYLEYGTSRGIKPKPIVGKVVAGIADDLTHFLANFILEGA